MFSFTLISLIVINVILLFLTRFFDLKIQYCVHFFIAFIASLVLPIGSSNLEGPLQILLIITTIMSLGMFNNNIISCLQEFKNKYFTSLIVENLAMMIGLCISFSLILKIAPIQILLIASLLTIPSTITMNYIKTVNDNRQTTLIIYIFLIIQAFISLPLITQFSEIDWSNRFLQSFLFSLLTVLAITFFRRISLDQKNTTLGHMISKDLIISNKNFFTLMFIIMSSISLSIFLFADLIIFIVLTTSILKFSKYRFSLDIITDKSKTKFINNAFVFFSTYILCSLLFQDKQFLEKHSFEIILIILSIYIIKSLPKCFNKRYKIKFHYYVPSLNLLFFYAIVSHQFFPENIEKILILSVLFIELINLLIYSLFEKENKPSPKQEQRKALKQVFFQELIGKRIVSNIKVRNKYDAITLLTYKLTEDFPDINPQKLLSSIIERENLESTYVNNEIAIPHCHMSDIPFPIGIIGRFESGESVNWNHQNSNEYVRTIVVLVSPKEPPEIHLEALKVILKSINKYEE